MLRSTDKHGNLHFTFVWRAESADAHECSQAASPVTRQFPTLLYFLLVVASVMHLDPGSEKQGEIVDFQIATDVPSQATLFFFISM